MTLKAGFTIDNLIIDSYSRATKKGWWENPPGNFVVEKLALIHSEVSEALEDYREGRMRTTRADYGPADPPSKPEGFPSELADIMIRVADLAGRLDIDLDEEIRKKAAFNETRPHRHGGKKC